VINLIRIGEEVITRRDVRDLLRCQAVRRGGSRSSGAEIRLPGRQIIGFRQARYHGIVKLKIVLEPSDEGGYTVFVPALPGCISEGDTREEALANIRQAIELYLEPRSSGRRSPSC
jgi:predicted RNase H-like HicB family nuclease